MLRYGILTVGEAALKCTITFLLFWPDRLKRQADSFEDFKKGSGKEATSFFCNTCVHNQQFLCRITYGIVRRVIMQKPGNFNNNGTADDAMCGR